MEYNAAANLEGHLLGGIATAVIGFYAGRKMKPLADRANEAKECRRSIEYILDHEKALVDAKANTIEPAVEANDIQYAINVANVSQYFLDQGILKTDKLSFVKKTKQLGRDILYGDSFTYKNHSAVALFAIIAETTETFVSNRFYELIGQGSMIPSLGLNVLQIPCFLTGMYAGRAVTYLIPNSKEERDTKKDIKTLIAGTKIVDLVASYQPTENTKRQLNAQGIRLYGSKLTSAGKKIVKQVASATGTVIDVVAHHGEKVAAREREVKETRIKRFEEITKGR